MCVSWSAVVNGLAGTGQEEACLQVFAAVSAGAGLPQQHEGSEARQALTAFVDAP